MRTVSCCFHSCMRLGSLRQATTMGRRFLVDRRQKILLRSTRSTVCFRTTASVQVSSLFSPNHNHKLLRMGHPFSAKHVMPRCNSCSQPHQRRLWRRTFTVSMSHTQMAYHLRLRIPCLGRTSNAWSIYTVYPIRLTLLRLVSPMYKSRMVIRLSSAWFGRYVQLITLYSVSWESL